MPLPRFHVDVPLAVGQPQKLPHAATRHALRVLRLRPGDRLTLFDGNGGEYAAQLVTAREPEAEVQVTGYEPRDVELPWPITLAQGLSSGDRMDWTIEKAVELGVSSIVPIAMARSVTRLSDERAASRRAHWQAIATAATEQCGRTRVATVEPVVSWNDWLSALPDAVRFVLAPDGASIASQRVPVPGRRIVLWVGPEGGFDADELRAADLAGFRPLSLGPRVLRTETAGPAAIAMLSAYWHAT